MKYSRLLIRTMMTFIMFHQVMLNSISQEVVTWNDINPDLYHKLWTARWIGCPESVTTDFGVYNFRRSFELSDIPGKFVIHVSGDNRYKLFVNGTYICNGPARCDVEHWNFETVDIARLLKPGRNVISAIVWNFGDHRPVAQVSLQTGFIVQGNSPAEEIVNTGKGWKVIKNEAYTILPSDVFRIRGYFAAGPGENVNASKYPWGWQLPDYDDSYWKHATLKEYGHSKKMGTDIYRCLQPRPIPFMEETQQDLASVRREEGVYVDPAFLRGQKEIVIPPNTSVRILFDQGVNTVAYPELITSAGRNAMIALTYSEALYDKEGNKGNRNEIEGKHITGYADIFISEGGENRSFRTLWYRTFRYLEMQVRTTEEALVINRLHSYFTGYPFRENAAFDCSDPSLKDIWNVGWRTARLCAGETYVDCPYYEQLQYVGDTRIQALISLYVSGDDRLMRNAITLLDDSMIPEGMTRSRYPSYLPQNIPPFSLYWINMIHDYWRYRDDSLFVKSFLPGMEAVLGWFERKLDTSSGLLGAMPYWNFVDWAPEWNQGGINSGGTPGGGITGGSAILSLQFVKAMQDAAEIFRAFGDKTRAAHYDKLSALVIKGVRKHCWDEK